MSPAGLLDAVGFCGSSSHRCPIGVTMSPNIFFRQADRSIRQDLTANSRIAFVWKLRGILAPYSNIKHAKISYNQRPYARTGEWNNNRSTPLFIQRNKLGHVEVSFGCVLILALSSSVVCSGLFLACLTILAYLGLRPSGRSTWIVYIRPGPLLAWTIGHLVAMVRLWSTMRRVKWRQANR